jgi:hypothetical protein
MQIGGYSAEGNRDGVSAAGETFVVQGLMDVS